MISLTGLSVFCALSLILLLYSLLRKTMSHYLLTVSFQRRNKDCFCTITSHAIYKKVKNRRGGNPVCVKVTTSTGGGGPFYLSADDVCDARSGQGDILSISGLFANQSLGLQQDSKVYVEVIEGVPSCRSVVLEPLSVDDSEILELHANEVRDSLLSQVRMVWDGQTIPVFVLGKIVVFGKCGAITSDSSKLLKYAMLHQGTEVHLSVQERRRALSSAYQQPLPPVAKKPMNKKDGGFLGKFFSAAATAASYLSPETPTPMQSHSGAGNASGEPERLPSIEFPEVKQWPQFYSETPIILRVETMYTHESQGWWSSYPSVCIISKDMVNEATSGPFIADLTLLMSPFEIDADEAKQRKAGTPLDPKIDRFLGTVCVIVEGTEGAPPVASGRIVLDEMFCKLHNLTITCKVKLEKVESPMPEIKTITLQSTQSLSGEGTTPVNENEIISSFWKYVADGREANGYPFVVNKSSVINMNTTPDSRGSFLLMVDGVTSPSDSERTPHYLLTADILPHIKVKVNHEVTERCNKHAIIPSTISAVDKYSHVTPTGCPELYESCLSFVKASLHSGTYGGLLINGSRGSGKTTLASYIISEMYKQQRCYTHKLDSKQLKGKRADGIRKEVDKAIGECRWRQPSILFIEDLDSLCKAPSGPEEESSPDTVYSMKVAEVLKDKLDEMWRSNKENGNRIVVIATSISRSTLHEKLTPTHGVHLFHLIAEIPSLTQSTRRDMLKSVMESNGVTNYPPDVNLLSLCDKLEGYVAQDLVSLVRRASHAHAIRTSEHPVETLTLEDFDSALQGFTPASLRGVTLHSPGENTWKDVGGLHNIKDQLCRMLEWPTKYRKLYDQCPIRLQSGVLLYGAPGTGKTLIAAVVAKEMGLNFISIKGPELLNKYIGASEQGVRDTFTRAQSVRPCILFFDEFESLAPKRGHDSTGVTDRVVNQLLTQLDGVEALEGVYVLAATSRPDLIDPALLRPGRLDKSLSCDIPSAEDRLEIIQALSRNMALDEEVTVKELQSITDRCENCTGADIKSLLVNAQLEAVHDVMSKSAEPKEESSETEMEDSDMDTVRGIYKPANGGGIETITPNSHSFRKIRKLSDRYYKPSDMKRKLSVTRQESTNSTTTVKISKTHLEIALANLKPSVSEEEREKYHMIYERFTGKTSGKKTTNVNELLASLQQRVSLM